MDNHKEKEPCPVCGHTAKQDQEIYNEGYKQGKKDQEALFSIGNVRAQNGQLNDFKAIRKLVEENTKLSDEYKRGKIEAIDLYMGMIEFGRDMNKIQAKEVVEEQARIIRNRMEQRYREAVDRRRLDHQSYTQILACIEATYQEFFFAGFRVGTGEIIGPQQITVNRKQ